MAVNIQDMEALIDGCLHNDRQSQRMLYDCFAPSMLGVCARYTNSKEDAEDVLIEGFLTVFKEMPNFRREGSLTSWIRAIMVNKAVSVYRANRKFLLNDPIDENNGPQNLSSDDDEVLYTRLEAQQVIKLMEKMPMDWRVIFNMRVVDGCSFKEISEYIDRNENTVRVYFQRARLWLQREIQEEESKL